MCTNLPETSELKKDEPITRRSVCTESSSSNGRNTPGNIKRAYCSALSDFSQSEIYNFNEIYFNIQKHIFTVDTHHHANKTMTRHTNKPCSAVVKDFSMDPILHRIL